MIVEAQNISGSRQGVNLEKQVDDYFTSTDQNNDGYISKQELIARFRKVTDNQRNY